MCILIEWLFISKNVVHKGKILLKSCNYLFSDHFVAIKRRWNTKGMSPCCKLIIFLSIVGLQILVKEVGYKAAKRSTMFTAGKFWVVVMRRVLCTVCFNGFIIKNSCSHVSCLNLTRAAGENIKKLKYFATVRGVGVKLGCWCLMNNGHVFFAPELPNKKQFQKKFRMCNIYHHYESFLLLQGCGKSFFFFWKLWSHGLSG